MTGFKFLGNYHFKAKVQMLACTKPQKTVSWKILTKIIQKKQSKSKLILYFHINSVSAV